MPTGTSGAHTAQGSEIYVEAGPPGTRDQSGFEALSWTLVKDISEVGEFGPEYETIEHRPINEDAVFKFIGTANYGAFSLTMARSFEGNVEDPGQKILMDNRGVAAGVSVKVEHNDNPGGTSNSIDYFVAKVTNQKTSVGTTAGLTGRTVNLEIDGKVVEVDQVA